MADSKEYILEHAIHSFEEVEINGIYLIPTDEEYDCNGFMCMHVIGYKWDKDDNDRLTTTYYDLYNNHDVVDLRNFGVGGVSIDVEAENGLIRIFWHDRKTKKVSKWDAQLSIFAIYGEEII